MRVCVRGGGGGEKGGGGAVCCDRAGGLFLCRVSVRVFRLLVLSFLGLNIYGRVFAAFEGNFWA